MNRSLVEANPLPFAGGSILPTYPSYRGRRGYSGGYRGHGYRGYGYRGNAYASNRTSRLARLANDLNTLTVGYVAPPADRGILRRDLVALEHAGIRAPSSSVSRLTGHLIEYLPRRSTPALNTQRLAIDLESVVNGPRHSAAQLSSAVNSARGIFRASGLPNAMVETLTADMRSVSMGNIPAWAGAVVH